MDEFKSLLQKISRDLNPKDLEDLVHICSIEESRKASITSGHHLFTYLCQERRISEENVDYLKQILNAIHRHDLVSLVERFEGLETTDAASPESPIFTKSFNTRDIVNYGAESSQQSNMVCEESCRIKIPQDGTNQIPCCVVNWPCLQMSCYKIHLCYVILTVILILAIITTILCWYADVPKVSEHLKSKTSVRNAGIYVIVALLVTYIVLMFFIFIARKVWKKRQENSVLFSTANASATTKIRAADDKKTEHRQPAVGLQNNPSCEDEISDELARTSGSFVGNVSITTGDKEPILPQESES